MLAILSLVGAGLLGCSLAAAAPDPVAALPDWVGRAPETGLRVELVEPGASPRAPLRLAPALGSRQGVVVELDVGLSMTLGGVALPSEPLPPQTVSLGLEVTGLTADEVVYVATVQGVSVSDGALPAGATAALDSLVGAAVEVHLDTQGRLTSARPLAGGAVLPAAAESLGRIYESAAALTPTLPTEPVGVGAQWVVLQRAAPGGFPVAVRERSTLASRDGDRLVIERETEQELLDPAGSMAGLPDGAFSRFQAFHAGGAAMGSHHLAWIGPERAAEATDLDATVSLEMPGESPRSLRVELRARKGVRSGPAAVSDPSRSPPPDPAAAP
jgi:hypothetical protein